MHTKALITTLATGAITLLLLSSAFAWGPGHGRGWRGQNQAAPGWQDDRPALTEAQQNQLESVYAQLREQNDERRGQIRDKMEELETLLEAPEANASRIETVVAELNSLRGEQFKNRIEFAKEYAKVTGEAPRFGRRGFAPCSGPCRDGYDGRRGRGGRHGGYGQGMGAW